MHVKSHVGFVVAILLVSAIFLYSVVSINLGSYNNQAQVAQLSPVSLIFQDSPYTGRVNSPVNINVQASLPLDNSVVSVDKASIVWGDGITDTINQNLLNFVSGGSRIFTYSHTYLNAGTYNVTFSIEDSNGAKSAVTTTITVVVVPKPAVSLSSGSYSGTSGSPISINGTANAGSGAKIRFYTIDFGDGQNQTTNVNGSMATINTSHVYAAGNYTLTLKAIDSWNQVSNVASASVAVSSPVVFCNASLSPSEVSVGASSQTGSFSIIALNGPNCSWSAASDSTWLSITSPVSGMGNSTINYQVAANTGSSRVARITVNSVTFTINQTAAVVEPPQTQYNQDGTPLGLEEELRFMLNRGRFNSAAENVTRGTAHAGLPASSGPLAPNQAITLAARRHSEDMAKASILQHQTLPSSLYYNPATQPNPWDRMRAEGYLWSSAGENIAVGYPTATTLYTAWWNSSGHRGNMYNASLREIGNGYYDNHPTITYNYYTMDLGTSGSNTFFTDTIFYDQNANFIYESVEARAGIKVQLQVGTTTFVNYDISTGVGSFAIPISAIPSNSVVRVVISNPTTESVTLSVPINYQNYSSVILLPGESKVYGTFVKTSRNFGFRDLTPL